MGYSAQSLTIFELINDIESYYLPAIQREFVWSSEKIERLFDSLLRGYPIGTMLRWDVRTPAIHEFQFYELIRDYDVRNPHNIKANLAAREQCNGVLDGQQRITSLVIGLTGSYTEKLPRLWWNNPDAFPRKRLYINLLFKSEGDSEQRYQIKFLRSSQARTTEKAYWLPVGDILKYKTRDDLRNFYRSTPHRDDDGFVDTLDTLWNAIFVEKNVTFFAENRQELDEVLEIFVRLNTGGTPLSYSDLLLSLATATWHTHDAREEVTELVEQLNKGYGGSGFLFSKDFVLKAILVLSGSDVRFRAVNIRKKEGLEQIWDDVKACLKTVVRLLHTFGLDAQTLTAQNAVLPIAYYLYVRRIAEDGFISQRAYKEDRETIRGWLLKVLLGRVFGGQSDATLTGIRDVIRRAVQEEEQTRFPAAAILQYLNVRRGFTFSDEQIVSVVSETRYGDPYAFATLALLRPELNYQQSQFHIDHLYPASLFRRQTLTAAGLAPEDVQFALDHYNDLANLHLLVGSDNVAKQDQPLGEWLAGRGDAAFLRQMSLIPEGADLSLRGFRAFHEARRQRLISELRAQLMPAGIAGGAELPEIASAPAEESQESLVTGEASV
jgi:uncharacterized protein with ParB-like and HNH nuclease domain